MTPKTAKPNRRQYDALMCVCRGMTMKEAAIALSVSEKSIDNKLYRLKESMFMPKRNDLIRLAKSQKWIEYLIMPYEDIEPILVEKLIRGDF